MKLEVSLARKNTGCGISFNFAATAEHDLSASLAEGEGTCFSDAAGGFGDKDAFVFE